MNLKDSQKYNQIFLNKKRIVIKIGSSLLVESINKNLNEQQLRQLNFRSNWLNSLAQNIAYLQQNFLPHNVEFIIVTSGAVAIGKNILNNATNWQNSLKNFTPNANKNFNNQNLLAQKQALAALGQIELMTNYRNIFSQSNLLVAQILLTASDCNNRASYKNVCNTIENLLSRNIIPIINENDSVAIDEIKIGDNDRLAARVAQISNANLLILFSDINGLYTQNPQINPNATLIEKIDKIDKNIESLAGNSISQVGTGGMITKITAAKMATASNCGVIITSGKENDCLLQLFLQDSGKKFSFFLAQNKASQKKISGNKSKKISQTKKNWLSGIINCKGKIFIDKNAKIAIQSKKNSLLLVGVEAVQGAFKNGDAVAIFDNENCHIGNGISNYNSAEINNILQNKVQIKSQIGQKKLKPEIINLEYLVIF